MVVHVELPPTWHAVGLDDEGSTELSAFRRPRGGDEFTPNLTMVTRRSPASVPVTALANRALGHTARTNLRIAVFNNREWGNGPTAMVLRGFHALTLPSSGGPEQALVQFQLHAGLPAEQDGWHDVAQLVLHCADHQRELVEAEFATIVQSLTVDS
ncbi:MAG TPA: hypothetical protein VHW44_26865 [Pseudonocardiaceae bacterium]|jgi:hypothetical protein|nr:hypothetical protein [Pseudonocardiaceae bacterium]